MCLKTCFQCDVQFYRPFQFNITRLEFYQLNQTLTLKIYQVPHLGNIVGSVLSADVFSRYALFFKAL